MQSPKQLKPAGDMNHAVNAATLAVLSEISDGINNIECCLRALALLAKAALPAVENDVIDELLSDSDSENESD